MFSNIFFCADYLILVHNEWVPVFFRKSKFSQWRKSDKWNWCVFKVIFLLKFLIKLSLNFLLQTPTMLLVAALCFLTKLIYSSNTNSSCDTQSCEYGCYIDAATNQAICICPVGLTIKAEDLKTCVKIDTQIIFKETPVKIDGTIRPHGDQSKCFYHKMNAQCEKSPKLVIFEKMVFEGLLFSFIL